MGSWLKGMLDMIASWTVSKVGFGMAATGIVMKELAIVVIMIGILLWLFKCTKVFRAGAIVYLLGLVIEILGSLMI